MGNVKPGRTLNLCFVGQGGRALCIFVLAMAKLDVCVDGGWSSRYTMEEEWEGASIEERRRGED